MKSAEEWAEEFDDTWYTEPFDPETFVEALFAE